MSKDKKGKCFTCIRFYSKWCSSCSKHYSNFVPTPWTRKPKAEELKACPFCGSKESEWKDHPEDCYLHMIQEQVESALHILREPTASVAKGCLDCYGSGKVINEGRGDRCGVVDVITS